MCAAAFNKTVSKAIQLLTELCSTSFSATFVLALFAQKFHLALMKLQQLQQHPCWSLEQQLDLQSLPVFFSVACSGTLRAACGSDSKLLGVWCPCRDQLKTVKIGAEHDACARFQNDVSKIHLLRNASMFECRNLADRLAHGKT